MSGRARGVPPLDCINRDYPYQVAMRMIDGQEISGIRASGPYSSLCIWRGKVSDAAGRYEIFRFSDEEQAKAFRVAFHGEAFDYRDQVGASWDRGRGSRRDAKRRY